MMFARGGREERREGEVGEQDEDELEEEACLLVMNIVER